MLRVPDVVPGLLLFVAAAFAAPAFGQPAPAGEPGPAPSAEESPGAQESIDDLINLIEAETAIATASRINADYVPGIFTVLRGDDLEERGLLTVYEALGAVPGIDLSMTGSGEKRIIVRGVGSTYAPSTMKFMLNGVSLNSSLEGKAAVLLDIPIEQVERIEIVRGPGAVLYGEFASAGVVNVITRTGANRVFARAGSFGSWAGGASFSFERPESAFGISLNIAGWNADDTGLAVAADKWTGSILQQFSHAPGPANDDHQNVTGIFALHLGQFAFLSQYTESRYGDYFGFYQLLPEADREKVQGDGSLTVEASREVTISEDARANVKLGWARASRDWTAEVLPAGVRFSRLVWFEDGLFQDAAFLESRSYAETTLSTKVRSAHDLLLGLGVSYTSVVDASKEENGEDVAWVGDDTHRRLADVFVQDEFDVTDRFTLTGGLRYDAYDDVGDRLTPRVSAVYRLSDRHILKTQYAEAFRPPTFIELVGVGPDAANPDIEPEIIRTYEGGYIFKGPGTDARLTLFHSKLEKLIVVESLSSASDSQGGQPQLRFDNIGSATATGGEAELLHRFGRSLTAEANVSYVKTKDIATGEEIEGSANWLGNLCLTWQPHRRVSLAASDRYVGRRHRYGTDEREDLDGYNAIDLALNLFDLPFTAVTVRGGVKNLFNADVSYPSHTASYPDDYLRPGRQWWVQVSYAF